jgi:hypothetical protein
LRSMIASSHRLAHAIMGIDAAHMEGTPPLCSLTRRRAICQCRPNDFSGTRGGAPRKPNRSGQCSGLTRCLSRHERSRRSTSRVAQTPNRRRYSRQQSQYAERANTSMAR